MKLLWHFSMMAGKMGWMKSGMGSLSREETKSNMNGAFVWRKASFCGSSFGFNPCPGPNCEMRLYVASSLVRRAHTGVSCASASIKFLYVSGHLFTSFLLDISSKKGRSEGVDDIVLI